LSYLAALEKGMQPNTLIRDQPITFPPISGSREGDYWSPKNYDGRGGGILTLRQALENSRNLATVHLLEGGIEAKPAQSLDRLCALAAQMRIYRDCTRYYPFVLGAQPVRPIDLAAFYAEIANEGVRPTPHVVDSIEQDGATLYRYAAEPSAPVAAADRAAFYQLKTMLQGVLQRGTANALAPLAPYVAGKTGTTEDENDAWFVGFTNEVTVAVWLGYDNANGRRTLGNGATGGHVAVPIFEPIIQAVWSQVTPRTELAPPSAEANSQLSCTSVNVESRHRQRTRAAECLRRDEKGRPLDARYALVGREKAFAKTDDDESPRYGAARVEQRDNGNNTDASGRWGASDRNSWDRSSWDRNSADRNSWGGQAPFAQDRSRNQAPQQFFFWRGFR
jgi:membrane carboxypeptidase/penicillin-binding protein